MGSLHKFSVILLMLCFCYVGERSVCQV
ncbi:hypothetical protein EE612_020444 [Oryza sativa]|nr:hypothetical protein EE612_020444 [Oryza sativa]